jgi:hypothetical protein
MMLYAERRIGNLRSLFLYGQLGKCADCREYFSVFDAAIEGGAGETASEGFTERVMERLRGEPAYTPARKGEGVFARFGWARLAGCVYALCLAAGFVVMYNPEWFSINLSAPRLTDFFSRLSAAYDGALQAGQVAMQASGGPPDGAGYYALAAAAGLAAVVFFLFRREQSSGVWAKK